MILEGNIDGFLKGSIETIGKNPVINELNVSENGIYMPGPGVDGFAPVNVNVSEPLLDTLNVIENGTYTPPSNIDGFNEVVVNVPIPILDEITITSNGTYTPATELEGYNKINVNVPLPDNGYILNTGSGASVSYNNGVVLNLQNLKVNIEPVQSGSGDPSPTNVRPISGWDEVNVTVADDAETPTVSNVYTIDLDGIRYGGVVDVVSGVLTVDRGYLTIDDFNSSGGSGVSAGGLHWFDVKNKPKGKLGNKNICSICGYVENGWTSTITVLSVGISETISVRIYDSSESLSDFKDKHPNLQIVYELATPQDIQLTPTQIETLLGNNVITADTGSINNIEYFTK